MPHNDALYSLAVSEPNPIPPTRVDPLQAARSLAAIAFSRAAGAPLIEGNAVRLLVDAEANYAAWREAIRGARRAIYFENYIFRTDATGRSFRDLLTERAAQGVKVRLLLDWFGSMRTPRSFWGPLVSAGGEVRYHNSPFAKNSLGWLSRDHRKSLVIDGATGFVSGVCVSDAWLGDERRRLEPWRDTGVELRGPAVADLALAFAQVWAENGPPMPGTGMVLPRSAPAGDIAVRIIATAPNITSVYRLDLMIAAMAQERLWLTDAYFAGTAAYVQALRAAARDGVDVRLLVPGGSDLPWLRPLTTAGYRPLLEAGVRVFEWNGSMLHAKTAVADDRWARVGSTNLNIASWQSNFELDIAVEHRDFAAQMAEQYERDLARSTEIVLRKRKRVRLPCPESQPQKVRPGRGSLSRATAGALRFTRAVSNAVIHQRELGTHDTRALSIAASVMFILALLTLIFPRACAWTAGALSLTAATMLAYRVLRERRKQKSADTPGAQQA